MNKSYVPFLMLSVRDFLQVQSSQKCQKKKKSRWRVRAGYVNKQVEASWAGNLSIVMLRDLWSFVIGDSGGFLAHCNLIILVKCFCTS